MLEFLIAARRLSIYSSRSPQPSLPSNARSSGLWRPSGCHRGHRRQPQPEGDSAANTIAAASAPSHRQHRPHSALLPPHRCRPFHGQPSPTTIPLVCPPPTLYLHRHRRSPSVKPSQQHLSPQPAPTCWRSLRRAQDLFGLHDGAARSSSHPPDRIVPTSVCSDRGLTPGRRYRRIAPNPTVAAAVGHYRKIDSCE